MNPALRPTILITQSQEAHLLLGKGVFLRGIIVISAFVKTSSRDVVHRYTAMKGTHSKINISFKRKRKNKSRLVWAAHNYAMKTIFQLGIISSCVPFAAYMDLRETLTALEVILCGFLQCQPCSAVWLILSSNTFSSKETYTFPYSMSGVNLFVCFDRMLEKQKLTKLTSRFLYKQLLCEDIGVYVLPQDILEQFPLSKITLGFYQTWEELQY